MEIVYSKVKPQQALHVIYRFLEASARVDLLTPENPLQVSACTGYPAGHTFKGAHRHLPQERITPTTSESWIVIQGALEVTLFDLDDQELGKIVLKPGDCYAYIGGGHRLCVLEPDTFFYECKNGPYNGTAQDKVFFSTKSD